MFNAMNGNFRSESTSAQVDGVKRTVLGRLPKQGMACPVCGGDDIISVDNNGIPSFLCDSCGSEIDLDGPDKENGSMEEVEEDDEDHQDEDDCKCNCNCEGKDGDYDKGLSFTEAVKQIALDFGDSETVLPKKLKSEAASTETVLPKKLKSEASTTSPDRKKRASQPRSKKPESTEGMQETSVQICISCGGKNLIYDSIHETEHLICEDCGAFTEKQELVSSHECINIGGSSAIYQWSRAPGPRFMNVDSQINRRKVYGVQRIRHMSSQLNWQTFLTDQAVAMYEKLYPHDLVKHTSNALKDALCVACMYSVARENKTKLTLKTLMGLKNVKKKLVTKALKLLKNILEKPLAHQTVSSLPEHVLAGCEFSTGFLEKVSKLVTVCEKGFVTQGRDHSNIIISVAHLVWISEDYRCRKSVSLVRFCTQHNLQLTRHSSVVQKHVKDLFVTLASQLPWVRGPIKQKDYLHYLDSIATFGLSVVSRATQQDAGSRRESPDSSRCSSVEGETSGSSPLPVLAPPCMRSGTNLTRAESPARLPAHLTAADLDKEDLSDTEFSDEEIASYLLTPNEVQFKQSVLQKVLDFQPAKKQPVPKKLEKLDRTKLDSLSG